MTDFPWLLTMIAVPAVGAAVVAALPRGRDETAKQAALGVSLLVLLLAVLATVAFDAGGERFQLTTSVSWIPDFGVDFALGVDGIALVMLLLIGVLVPVVVLASWRDEPTGHRSVKTFFAWLLLLESLMVGVFAATDVFLFYVFFEAMLVPMYFLIGSFGGPRRQYAAVKFFLYSLVGGLVMLAAVIGLYVVSAAELGEGTFAFDALRGIEIDPGVQKLLFLGFFVAFAIKAPLVPFHTWLPDSGAEAPIGGSVLLVGVLDKVGTFGFLRYCLPLFPDASRDLAPYVLALAVAGVLYAALLAMGQSDMKRLVSYTSIAHFGFIALGIFAFTTEAATGSVLYMVNHGIATGLLFLVVGMLIARGGSREVGDYGGVAAQAPLLAGVFLVAGLASLALPGTNSFVSEFLVLIGSFPTRPVFTVLATVGIVLAALYVLLLYQRTMHGPPRGVLLEPSPGTPAPATGGGGGATAATATLEAPAAAPARLRVRDLSRRELAVAAPMVALVIALGVYPQPLIDLIEPAVAATMSDVGADPAGVSPEAPVEGTD
ncbi:NADH-quinone oxidoreductase subunit M [Geodermatophilus obscurus]|uniref:Proton-translocating NADH-quinone oxidoreductase, chain M n=1 Tax=Geodermatophilus obscurus (strain ATCC 25078 / DSM 43160 / JCM 3152 / CCUG 61914 / KCC A-0152 / KCTC 9177 / NBRC 13315 / NRRL B-3577 / G-20) TaxID=526225 RepID=D2SHE2_GEOOG|nr:NADH-quinone oxidoreductase subunit M [Geodermatophilus obscurus]ADB77096.1 proton-translocating NADH-quinone oxidoreductase, chain M [Geodermatophilus obscurus DSM 43160]